MQRAADEPREPRGAERRRTGRRQGRATAEETCRTCERGEAEAVTFTVIPPRYTDAAVQSSSAAVSAVSRGEPNF